MAKNGYEILEKLRGIKNYIEGLRNSPVNPEYGYVYNNETEFEEQLQDFIKITSATPDEMAEMRDLILYLGKDINITKEREVNPIRNEAEEAFYRKIVGINSYIRETKLREPGYVFDNIQEVIGEKPYMDLMGSVDNDPDKPKRLGLLDEVQTLDTKDPDILSIMHSITADIKLVIGQRFGPEAQGAFQERLDSLDIGIKTRQY